MVRKLRQSPAPTQREITPELVRSALACIPPDVEREIWVRVGMAIKSELGDGGFDPWNDWSQQGSGYSAADARDAWRSIKAGGKVKIGTLFGIAKDHGFEFPEPGAVQTSARSPEAKAEAERIAAVRAKQREVESEQYRRRAEDAAAVARHMWADAAETGQSGYLARKGVRGHGVRFASDGTLLVPMRDSAGELQNVQRIAPSKPSGGRPEKLFLAGGRKSGLMHWIGDPAGAEVLLLAEGYATAASIHEATGRPVAVAFDAGNLVHVARELRSTFPLATLLVCGDDDRDTEARTGQNPGREKAAAAARAADAPGAPAGAVFPDGLPDGGSDFNDLAQHAGVEAVRALIEPAAASPQVPKARRGRKSGAGAPIAPADMETHVSDDFGGSSEDSDDRAESEASTDGTAPGDNDPFHLDRSGLWFTAPEKRPMWICTGLRVAALTRADDRNGWGFLLEFRDSDGHAKSWAMPSSMLSGDGAEWAGRLRDMGLRMAPGSRPRNLLAQYIDTRRVQERVTCVDRVGWHGPVYVLPSGSIASKAIASEGQRYVFQSDSGMEDTFRRHGALEAWRDSVAALAVGNSRLAFALCCAFAGPLLRLVGMESGGFHFRGDSSQGKTTALKVAASVWGRPSYMQRWRTTDNALEATAVQHCDCTLILDEFGQLDPRVAGECAYMLANDQEKGRATRGGLARKRRTWRLLFLSSGEVSLSDHMAEAGKRTRAGMEVRMLDVPLDAGMGMGGIEVLHGQEGAGALADAIVSAATREYGTAGRAWLEWLCERVDVLPDQLQVDVDRIRAELVPEAASEQVRRAGSRFALVAVAGELATKAGITGWAVGEAERAVRKCFASWLGARGHMDNGEDAAMLHQVRRFLELNGEGRFAWWHRAMDDHTPKTLNRAGFRRLLDDEGKPIKSDSDHMREYGERMNAADADRARVDYIILREVFEREVCQGFDARAVAKLLHKRGHLQGEGDRLQDRQRLPGMGGDKVPCYHFKPSIFSDEL
jgi:putative DNA primase/helicase